MVIAKEPSKPTRDAEFEEFLDMSKATSTGCKTCKSHPKVVGLLDRWMERRLDQSTHATLREVWAFAQKVHRYPFSVDSLRRHLQRCRTENYEKVRAGE